MKVGAVKETYPGERRVALVPGDLPRLARRHIEVLIERGAGQPSGYLDAQYEAKGAKLASRQEVFEQADLIAQVRGPGANADHGEADLQSYRTGQIVFGFFDPLGSPQTVVAVARTKVTAFSVEMVPRITRAQSMDALSSMANLGGYRAVLLAATRLPKLFPMMMTAAGTVQAAQVFVVGVGVAGLQAIATAKRLGAVVYAYDIRPEVKEQVQSVGGKFVELDLSTEGGGDTGGYAQEQPEDFYARQQELMSKTIAASDVVITTAAVPGRKAPVLVTQSMVEGMRPGSVIVDLAAETGGNCELTRAGQEVNHHDVLILGPRNIPSELPYHASQLYSRNVVSFIELITDKEGNTTVDLEDEIVAAALLCEDGQVKNQRVLERLQEGT